MQIKGGVFIVTGGTFGIGEALCEKLADLGAKLSIAGRNKEQGAALVKRLTEKTGRKNEFLFVATDIGEMPQVKNLFDATMKHFGDLTCIINNAGVSGLYVSDVMKGQDEWMKTLAVDLTGALYLSRLAMTHWVRSKRRGLIVNTGSIAEFLGHTDPTYSVAKAGMSAQSSTIKIMGDITGTPYGRLEVVRAVTIAVGFVWSTIWFNNSGGKWTTPKHVEDDPGFGPDLERAGGWTAMEYVIDTFIKVIENDSVNGETVIVSGNYPVQRKTMHMSDDEWRAFMSRKSGPRL